MQSSEMQTDVATEKFEIEFLIDYCTIRNDELIKEMFNAKRRNYTLV